MSGRSFTLIPFPGCLHPEGLLLSGMIDRHGDEVSAVFELSGDLGSVEIPGLVPAPERKDGLWKDTCCEVFLGPSGQPGYWEFNLSPAGHWNAYRFDDYRRGMRREEAFTDLPLRVLSKHGSLSLSIRLMLKRILPPGTALDVGLSAVLRSRGGLLSYWAQVHCGPKPDFHNRKSFIMTL